jgi:hypothetical protein
MTTNEIAVSALQAAGLLYIAHESIKFDTENDVAYQAEFLAEINKMCPELKMVVAGLKERINVE